MRAFPALPGPACRWLGLRAGGWASPGAAGFFVKTVGACSGLLPAQPPHPGLRAVCGKAQDAGSAALPPRMAEGKERPSLPCRRRPRSTGVRAGWGLPCRAGPMLASGLEMGTPTCSPSLLDGLRGNTLT